MQKIRAGEATPFELIAKTKELGFDAIEFVDFVDFGTAAPKEERLALRRRAPRGMRTASALRSRALVIELRLHQRQRRRLR
jgi:sugar phosphate isomerase/epimerase